MPNRFPIGSWITDLAQAEYSRGLKRNPRGRWTFSPYRGQIKRWGSIGKAPAYVIQFGRHEGVILANNAQCDSCGARDDAEHSPLCYELAVRGQRKGKTR